MLIKDRTVVKWKKKNKEHYLSFGYIFTAIGDPLTIDIDNICEGDGAIVKVLCDYCEDEIMERKLKTHKKQVRDSIIKKDACVSCRMLKVRETNLIRYGTDFYTQTEEFKEKSKATNLDRYGAEFYQSTEEFQEKTKATHLERYGVEYTMQSPELRKKSVATLVKNHGVTNPMHVEEFRENQRLTIERKYGVSFPLQSPEILEKTKQTNLQRYGFSSPAGSQEVQEKMRQTSMDRYGVPHPMQNPEVRKKLVETLYKNGTMSSSSQQNHIHDLIGGDLNYPVSHSSLDIAFPDEMIYVEYDGGGHNLNVKLGKMTQEEFDQRDKRRTFFLFDMGWKEIRLVSDTDKLPEDFEILKTVEKAKYMLKRERVKTIIVNWDNRMVLFGFKREFPLDDFLSDSFILPNKEVA